MQKYPRQRHRTHIPCVHPNPTPSLPCATDSTFLGTQRLAEGSLLHCSKREQQSERHRRHLIATLAECKLPSSEESSPNPTYRVNGPPWAARELMTVDDFRRR